MPNDKAHTTKYLDSEALERIAKRVVAKMRRQGGYSAALIRDALFKANSKGYAEGHDDQMNARILEAQERRRDAKA